MVLRQPAPIVPAVIRRTAFGHHTIRFLPQLELPNLPDRDEDILAKSLAFNKAVENIIRQAPDQYFWFHNRWK
jgi:KDO2-lipid IV(A) lauroyltransferase